MIRLATTDFLAHGGERARGEQRAKEVAVLENIETGCSDRRSKLCAAVAPEVPEGPVMVGEQTLESRDRDEQESTGLQPRADHVAKEGAVVGDVLDDIEREDEIEVTVADRSIRCVPLDDVVGRMRYTTSALRKVNVDADEHSRTQRRSQ